jgi:predicted transcriptional regulator
MMNKRILKIGIASREEQQARTLAIAKGYLKPNGNDPKVWFTSIESFAQVLSTKNKLLLEIIHKSRPASLKELSELSGREVSNLSRTLHTMARYGFVELEKTENGRLMAFVPYEGFCVETALAA